MNGESEVVATDHVVSNEHADGTTMPSGNGETSIASQTLSGEKRTRSSSQDIEMVESPVKRQKGVAPIKAE